MSKKNIRYKCRNCGDPALYYSKVKRRMRGDAQHTLCSRCHETAIQEGRKKALVAIKEWEPPKGQERIENEGQ